MRPFKTNLKELDVYFPILFKLEDDAAIIHSDLLSYIRTHLNQVVYDKLQLFELLDEDNQFHYNIATSFFSDIIEKDPEITAFEAHGFYYHHRFIFHAKITYEKDDFAFRKIRMLLIERIRDMTDKIVESINKLIKDAKNSMKDSAEYSYIISNLDKIEIKTFYSYCLVFQPKRRSFLKKNNQIQTFNIRTLQPRLLPINRTSLLRISIPNMTAYYSGKLSTEFVSELINTVYKTCLYKKKIDELEQTNQFIKYNYNVTKGHQVITEKMIMDMWTYSMDSFGGKRTDQIGNKGAVIGLIFSIVALVLSIVSFIL